MPERTREGPAGCGAGCASVFSGLVDRELFLQRKTSAELSADRVEETPWCCCVRVPAKLISYDSFRSRALRWRAFRTTLRASSPMVVPVKKITDNKKKKKKQPTSCPVPCVFLCAGKGSDSSDTPQGRRHLS